MVAGIFCVGWQEMRERIRLYLDFQNGRAKLARVQLVINHVIPLGLLIIVSFVLESYHPFGIVLIAVFNPEGMT